MELIGKISKINTEYKYGFITTKDRKEVFFSLTTDFVQTSFDALSVNDAVNIVVEETNRGLFARSLTLPSTRKSMNSSTKNQNNIQLG